MLALTSSLRVSRVVRQRSRATRAVCWARFEWREAVPDRGVGAPSCGRVDHRSEYGQAEWGVGYDF